MLALSVGIAYDSNVEAAIAAIRAGLATLDGLSQARPILVGIDSFDDSAITLGIRCWVLTRRFHELKYACNLRIHESLSSAGVAIPFPQREVRMLNS